MGLSVFQRGVCQLLAQNRLRSGESYVAGGAALNELLRAPRLSRDIDLFHDTEEALMVSWQADRSSLERASYTVRVFRERPGLVEAEIARGDEVVLIQWARDSAYRFFPLVEHDELGLALHPFDLATSKVLALVGRVEPRDFVDTLTCNDSVQPFGYLSWAASAKDPGFSPAAILEEAARANRYASVELRGLDFEGDPPDAGDLSRRWRAMLAAAREIVKALPPDNVGRAVLAADGGVFRGDPIALRAALSAGHVVFHQGSIRGAMPRVV
jgi:hypothetical protein